MGHHPSRVAVSALVFAAILGGCSAPSPAEVERLCAERARAAAAPSGAVGVELGSGGSSHVGIGLSVSHDYIVGRDPDDVYRSCMARSTAGAEVIE
ncbi:hypothetical protein LX81_00991 [Palleronia aestuarii]|uniref:Lipoprotein n=1 Tax=Palleronia aestuarii TaxID=568105 RepID=A0A2W7ND90_9RHOB|nr:hypothetical protein [Palleronia aestuarii]PZX18361.1 hypothetical protein LX81_00991 [Palleronia aestuarii]